MPLRAVEVGSDYLKGLVYVEARVRLQSLTVDLKAGPLKRFLKAPQVLRHGVDKRTLDVKNIA